jgi:putative oxidoreductase
MDLTCSFLDRHRDYGLLIIRVGVGALFMVHGWPKITGGMEMWAGLGGAMGVLGIGFAPSLWGFLAAASEFGGGLLLMLGLLARPATFFLLFTMLVASLMHITGGDGFATFSHPLKLVFVFAGLLLAGPGKYSIDAGIARGSSEPES